MPGFRPRTPPPPPPPQPPRTPSPPPPPSPPRSRSIPPADSSRPRDVWIPVSDGSYVTLNGDTSIVRNNYTGSITITRDSQGRKVLKEEPLEVKEEEAFTLPPFTSLMSSRRRNPPLRPPPPTVSSRTSPPPPPRWVSPPRPQRPATSIPRDPPPPYQGLIIHEVPQRPRSPPPPYGEVEVQQNAIGVRGKYCICFFLFLFLIFLFFNECDL